MLHFKFSFYHSQKEKFLKTFEQMMPFLFAFEKMLDDIAQFGFRIFMMACCLLKNKN
jgi:hypothetical protein